MLFLVFTAFAEFDVYAGSKPMGLNNVISRLIGGSTLVLLWDEYIMMNSNFKLNLTTLIAMWRSILE